jgi:hypothetical protein
MKKILTAAILGLTALAGAAGAEANEGHGGRDHRRPVQHRRHHARLERRWVAPRYETRIVGEDCGRPVTRVVLVTPGHWTFGPDCR